MDGSASRPSGGDPADFGIAGASMPLGNSGCYCVRGRLAPGCARDERLELLAGVEGHDAARSYRDLLAGLGIAPRPRGLVAQLKIAKSRELDRLAALERLADLVEKTVHHVLGLALVQAQALKQRIGDLGLGHRARIALGLALLATGRHH